MTTRKPRFHCLTCGDGISRYGADMEEHSSRNAGHVLEEVHEELEQVEPDEFDELEPEDEAIRVAALPAVLTVQRAGGEMWLSDLQDSLESQGVEPNTATDAAFRADQAWVENITPNNGIVRLGNRPGGPIVVPESPQPEDYEDGSAARKMITLLQHGPVNELDLRRVVDVDRALEELRPGAVFCTPFGGAGLLWHLGPKPRNLAEQSFPEPPAEPTLAVERAELVRARTRGRLQSARMRRELHEHAERFRAERTKRAVAAAGSWREDGSARPINEPVDAISLYNAAIKQGVQPRVAAATAGLRSEPVTATVRPRDGRILRSDGKPFDVGTYAYRRSGDRISMARLDEGGGGRGAER